MDNEGQYEQDKVYMRDKRNGQIYVYEHNLERNANFETCVPNPSPVAEEKGEESEAGLNKDEGSEAGLNE